MGSPLRGSHFLSAAFFVLGPAEFIFFLSTTAVPGFPCFAGRCSLTCVRDKTGGSP